MKLRLPHIFSRRDALRLSLPVLALALIASVVAGREKPSAAPAQPASRIEARVSAKAALDHDLDLSALARAPADAQMAPASDPFARLSFAPPAPAPAPAQAQAKAAGSAPAGPPPLPFTYLGKMIEDGKLRVFVARGGESHTLRAGEKLEQYRVDKVSEAQVTFTYLPLKARQTLDIPAAP